MFFLVRPARFERATSGSVDRRSIQLSYGRAEWRTHSTPVRHVNCVAPGKMRLDPRRRRPPGTSCARRVVATSEARRANGARAGADGGLGRWLGRPARRHGARGPLQTLRSDVSGVTPSPPCYAFARRRQSIFAVFLDIRLPPGPKPSWHEVCIRVKQASLNTPTIGQASHPKG